MKAWATWAIVLIASIPLAWSLLAASDVLWALAIQMTLIGITFFAGYFLNRRRVSARLLLFCGLPLMVLTPALALSSDGVYSWALLGLFLVGTILNAAGIGTVMRGNIARRRKDRHPQAESFQA